MLFGSRTVLGLIHSPHGGDRINCGRFTCHSSALVCEPRNFIHRALSGVNGLIVGGQSLDACNRALYFAATSTWHHEGDYWESKQMRLLGKRRWLMVLLAVAAALAVVVIGKWLHPLCLYNPHRRRQPAA